MDTHLPKDFTKEFGTTTKPVIAVDDVLDTLELLLAIAYRDAEANDPVNAEIKDMQNKLRKWRANTSN
jgi:hypothetical protein